MGRLIEKNKNVCDLCGQRDKCIGNDCQLVKLYNKLAHYEDLEERIEKLFDGKISLNEAVEEIEKKVHGEEVFRYSRILTNAEAEKWDRWLDLEEQGRLIELPYKVGSKTYYILPYYNYEKNENEYKIDECPFEVYMSDEWGEWVFSTKEEAEAKLKELKGE